MQRDNSKINYAVFVFGHDSKRSRSVSRKLHNKLIQFKIDANDETMPRQDFFFLNNKIHYRPPFNLPFYDMRIGIT